MADVQKVTEQDAADALRMLSQDTPDTEPEKPPPEPEVIPEPDITPDTAETVEAEAAPSDDVESLKQRLAAHEASVKELNETLTTVRDRAAKSSAWARDLALRKSDQINKAQRLLRQALSEQGVVKDDVEKLLGEIDAGVSEKSSSYRPVQRPAAMDDDAVMAENDFLNDTAMSAKEQEAFKAWIQSPDSTLTDRDRGITDTYALLQTAYRKFDQYTRTKDNNTAATALKTVKKVQTAAARAADTKPKAPIATSRQTDMEKFSKMTATQMKDSGIVEEAFRLLRDR